MPACSQNRFQLSILTLLYSAALFGQQSLFNVPSSEITKQGRHFFQEQIAFGDSILQSNSSYCYGLPHNMEVGVDILNLDLNFSPSGAFFLINNDDPSRAISPLVVASFQKGFEFSDWLRIGIGVQAGMNLLGGITSLHPLLFTYVNSVTRLFHDAVRVYLGGFFGNVYYLGQKDHVQWMGGLEIPIVRDELHFVADHLHGQHNLGVSVVGLTYFPNKDFAISAGAQLPNPGTDNSYGAVVEFTWL